MSINAAQYRVHRQTLTTRLAANDPRAANPSYGQLLNLFNQLDIDATGAVYLSPPRQASMTAEFRAALAGPDLTFPNPSDADVAEFAVRLATDYLGAAPPDPTQYQIFLRSFAALVSPGAALSLTELRGYYAALLSL